MASKVPHCDDVEPIRVECVEEIVRETTHEHASQLSSDRRAGLGPFECVLRCTLHGGKEGRAKSRSNLLVSIHGSEELLASRDVELKDPRH